MKETINVNILRIRFLEWRIRNKNATMEAVSDRCGNKGKRFFLPVRTTHSDM